MAIQANKDNYFDTGSLAKPPRFNKDNFTFWKMDHMYPPH